MRLNPSQDSRRQALAQKWRGGTALARWFIGAPLMAFRMGPLGRDLADARRILAGACEKALRRCRIEVTLTGEGPAPGKACVICFNEASFACILAMASALFPYADRLGGADIFKWIPFARSAFLRAGIELIPRGNRVETDKVMARAIDHAKGGARLMWGGEGRLSRMDGVARFKVGASLIAIRAQVPIYPVAVYGGHHCLALGSIRAHPGTIEIRFGDPIETAGLGEDDARDLADRVQAIVAAMYAELKAEHSRQA